MKYLSYYFCILLSVILIFSCKKEDGPEPVRELQEQALKDDEALVNYLQSHFYNYEEFKEDPNNYKIEISIDTIDDHNIDKTPLWDQVQTKTIELTDNNDNVIPNKMYYLVLREGVGKNPSRLDSTFVTYKGTLLN